MVSGWRRSIQKKLGQFADDMDMYLLREETNVKETFKTITKFSQCRDFRIIYDKTTIYRGGSRIPHRRGRQPSGRGRQHTNLPDFPRNYMKLRIFGHSVGSESVTPPLDPPLINCTGSLKHSNAVIYSEPTKL